MLCRVNQHIDIDTWPAVNLVCNDASKQKKDFAAMSTDLLGRNNQVALKVLEEMTKNHSDNADLHGFLCFALSTKNPSVTPGLRNALFVGNLYLLRSFYTSSIVTKT
ncbi:ORF3 protein [Anopheles triannulatus orthophasmavirus]|uniref:ORF3 protein n=1 Tax=Anopheles triannulatus orthophasmavirus TaxID=2546222 RepID=A0A481XUK3_9VIRU|nr:ORF3 protein [Anopheles triannulatus orthophasmavirus]QBK47221.1 ORF3 protein [Anopheles triannulatus orthophasmavirus]